jgi:predicted permease
MSLFRRLHDTFFRRRYETELDDEMRSHIEMRARELEDQGLSPEDADLAARRRFGNATLARERTRESDTLAWLYSVFQDVRYGLRIMRKTPLVTGAAVVSLALGIGANTAIFTLMNGVLLKSLSVKDAEQVVVLNWAGKNADGLRISVRGTNNQDDTGREVCWSFSYPTYRDLRATSETTSDVIGFADLSEVNVVVDGQAAIATGQVVSGNYHTGLGVAPAAGRLLTDDDDRDSAPPVAVISYRYWERRFAASTSAIGKYININNASFTIVGVEAAGFHGLTTGQGPEITVPIRHLSDVALDWERPGTPLFGANFWWVQIAARLKPGVSQATARANLDTVFHQSIAPLSPQLTIEMSRGGDGLNFLRNAYWKPLWTMLAVVGLVLLIACANVANLLLARAQAREKETAMRLALGAGRGRLARQLLTESLLLSVFGGAIGLVLAQWLSGTLTPFFSDWVSGEVVMDLAPDWRILTFTAVVTVATGALFGLAPALQAMRADLQPSLQLRKGSRRFGLARLLVVGQIALSLVVLVGAGLYLRTLQNLRHIDTGFNQRNLVVFRLDPSSAGYTKARLAEFYQRVMARLEKVPGVTSSAISRYIPLSGGTSTDGILVPGHARPSGKPRAFAYSNAVGPRFFETMGIPILLGRGIEDRDREGTSRVAVIDQAMVQEFFANVSPIGRHFQSGRDLDYEIVGVVRNSKYESIRGRPRPTFFAAFSQAPRFMGSMGFEVRTVSDPAAVMASVRRAVADVDGRVPITELHTEEETIDGRLKRERLFAQLSAALGLLALVLVSVGLYGVRAYSVARRTAEIGVRIALGAARHQIMRLIMRETAWLVAAGIAVGVTAALASTHLIRSMLFGLAPRDTATICAAAILLAIIAALAAYFPARRASRVDPMVALRHE